MPNLKIGKIGLEKRFDKRFVGSSRFGKLMKVNVFGKRVKQIIQKDGENGKVVKTTFDKDIQNFALFSS